MDGDVDANEDERAIELSSIAAIFPELVLDKDDPFSASLEIPVSPSKPLPVSFPPLTSSAATSVVVESLKKASLEEPTELHAESDEAEVPAPVEIKHISHLPPLKLDIRLPQGYPSTIPPEIVLSSSLSWMPEAKLKALEGDAKLLWEELGHDQVLYDYIDLLQQGADNGFGLALADGSALAFPASLNVALLDHDLKVKRQKFEETTFDCGVCLEPKRGAVCHQLRDCHHVFCVECLQDFYNNCITEGDVYSVKCLAPDCEQKSPTVSKSQRTTKTLEASELIQIPIPQEQVQRYVILSRKKRLESNKDTIFCPRKWCQGPAKSSITKTKNEDSASDSGITDSTADTTKKKELPPPGERLCVCEDCGFAFCCVCAQGWHGEFAPCFPRSQYELTAEERASEAYLQKHSQLCPTCRARCQKTMGCNHMECFHCKTHFCYLCRAFLDRENPYKHFNTPHLACYMQLWVMEEGDGEPDGAGQRVVDRNEALEILEIQAAPVVVAAPAPPPPAPAPPAMDEVFLQIRRAQRGPNQLRPLQMGNGNGLQQFLAMAAEDEENSWDSDVLDGVDGWDELDDDDD